MQRPNLVALATRLKMTPAQQAIYTEALIEEAGGDSTKISVSYSYADKSRRKVGRDIAASFKDEWIAPKLATLHWDSKLMPSMANKNISEERLSVLVGTASEIKLLGVPAYEPGKDRKSGDIIADLTVDLLKSWNCTDSIISMAFDTTASNTGHVTAACVTIQQRLGRSLLWNACRHHVGETILTHVFSDLQIEVSKSPDVTLFTRFRKNFQLLQSHPADRLSRFESSSFSGNAKTFTDRCREDVIKLAHSELDYRRDDYLEFVELCTVFLDCEKEGHTFTFKRPGALHKARWMAKLIYSIKICLFEEQIHDIPVGTITTRAQTAKVRDFVNFATLIYSTWWMTCSSATDAPWNDLMMFRSLLMYADVHPKISESALKAFKRHLWYLTEEMVPLALWSTKVPPAEQRALADRLLAMKPDAVVFQPQHRFGTGFGKPKFPQSVTLSTTLADFVGNDSWFLFNILQLDSEFLTEAVVDWPTCASYQASMINIQALNVVNDSAERGVKLSSDFLATAKSEEHYQNVLQVVHSDRKRRPDIRKRKKSAQ